MNFSLQARLLVLILVALLPGFCLTFYTHVTGRHTAAKEVERNAEGVAQLTAAHQEAVLNNSRQLLNALGQLPQVQGRDRAACQALLANLPGLFPHYVNFGLIGTNGVVFASALPAAPRTDLSDRTYFQRVLKTKRFSLGDFQVGRISGRPTINVAAPVFDRDGGFTRVIYAALDLAVLNELASRASLPPGGALAVLDRSGWTVARFPGRGESVGQPFAPDELLQKIVGTEDGKLRMTESDGQTRLFAFHSVRVGPDPSLIIAVGIPEAAAYSRANQLLLVNLCILAFAALIGLILARMVAERVILQPMHTVSETAKALAQGNMTARTGLCAADGEIGQFAAVFDDMADKLQGRQLDLERANQEIGALNRDLENRVRDRTAALECSNGELEAFSYSVSHDLRAPLRHIDGFGELLQKHTASRLDPQAAHYLGVIRDAAMKMGKLIEDLLQFSRMGKQSMRKQRVAMDGLVKEVIANLANDQGERVIEWNVASLPDVWGDNSMLRQVWTNLLSNAVKYTRPRPVARIEVGCQSSSSEHTFFVRDNGVGFDVEHAQKLFGVFQRLHDDAEFEGTGIGLANVRRIVSRHDGRTWADASPGKGAAFYFSLPKHSENRDPSGLPLNSQSGGDSSAVAAGHEPQRPRRPAQST